MSRDMTRLSYNVSVEYEQGFDKDNRYFIAQKCPEICLGHPILYMSQMTRDMTGRYDTLSLTNDKDMTRLTNTFLSQMSRDITRLFDTFFCHKQMTRDMTRLTDAS